MKRELLSPAGNMEALKSAVMNGSDAVYVGGKRFGARAYASNFSPEEMKEAIFFCHLYGVKLYVTVNTMIYESELEEVLSYLSFLYREHVDAVILSDLGLMKLCHERFPDFEIHASTQAHTHNVEQISFLRKLGVKRIVFARELSLSEIQQFPRDMEYEVFIHGALCISYSGQCLFSSLLFHRSGNRGECAQVCRLPFTLLEDGKEVKTSGSYLLSTRDLNTSTHFEELMKSQVTSFKIEGRMKSSAYVGYITGMYRNLIDTFLKTGHCETNDAEQKQAAVLFGRGFTEGKLFGSCGQAFMNQESSNHQGIPVGKVLDVNPRRIQIQLSDDLHQGDGIRFVSEDKGMIVNFLYDSSQLLISSSQKGNIVYVDNKIGLKKKGSVMKTLNFLLEEEVKKRGEKKIPITLKAHLSLKHGFTLELFDGVHSVSVHRSIVSQAKNCPITKSTLRKQLDRIQNTPFFFANMEIDMENDLFVKVSSINEIRRSAMDALTKKRVERKDGRIFNVSRVPYSYDQTFQLLATARNEEQLKTLLNLKVDGIYVSDDVLYQKYKCQNVIYRSNRVLHKIEKRKEDEMLVGETGSLSSRFGKVHTDYFLNVSNHATADVLKEFGADRITLTPEMNFQELQCLLKQYPSGNPFEVLVYGRIEAMVLNHCILQTNLHSDGICKLCKGNHSYALKDRNGAIYPVVMDEHHRTHLFYHKILHRLEEVPRYYQEGIRKFRLEFFDETPEEIVNVVKHFKENLQV